MPDDDMYGMGDGAGMGSDSQGAMDESSQSQDKSDDKDEMGETALLPKSFFQDRSTDPGEECKIKIVHDHGDDVEVSYVEEGSEKPDMGKPEMAMADQKLGEMAT